MYEKMLASKEKLNEVAKEIFNKYDEDNSGTIDFTEFANIMIDISK